MRTIKFRGRSLETGKFVYGYYIVGRCGQACIATNFTAAYEVDPESVAQLVGVDADGKEVYEGDLIIYDNGELKVASMIDCYTVKFATLKEEAT